ncbi:unnamed protein product [Leptosia nina]|uniref:Uncharacterized protein n=1 Tax=Leptosia nina TaxID=320188 RepID=A0AAV1J8R0_9NEOP
MHSQWSGLQRADACRQRPRAPATSRTPVRERKLPVSPKIKTQRRNRRERKYLQPLRRLQNGRDGEPHLAHFSDRFDS